MIEWPFRFLSFWEMVDLFGVAGAYAAMLLSFITFAGAYMDPRKLAVVYINLHGEANIEMVLFTAVFLLSSYVMYGTLMTFRRRTIYRKALETQQIEVIH